MADRPQVGNAAAAATRAGIGRGGRNAPRAPKVNLANVALAYGAYVAQQGGMQQ
jgi:hypothetical protein